MLADQLGVGNQAAIATVLVDADTGREATAHITPPPIAGSSDAPGSFSARKELE